MDKKTAIDLIQIDELSIDQLLKIGNKINEDGIWQKIAKKIETKFSNARSKANYTYSTAELLEFGYQADNGYIWDMIVEQLKK